MRRATHGRGNRRTHPPAPLRTRVAVALRCGRVGGGAEGLVGLAGLRCADEELADQQDCHESRPLHVLANSALWCVRCRAAAPRSRGGRRGTREGGRETDRTRTEDAGRTRVGAQVGTVNSRFPCIKQQRKVPAG